MQPLAGPALVVSTLAALKVYNSLLVKATGGAVGEIYSFTHHVYWLLTSAENSLGSPRCHFHRCFHQQSCSGQEGMGESSFPWKAACLQLLLLSLPCSHSVLMSCTRRVWNQWKPPTDLSKLTEISRKAPGAALHPSRAFRLRSVLQL